MLHLALSCERPADPQDGEVGRWVEIEVPQTVEELLTDAVIKEVRVGTERDQLILKWHR